jgi:hypothetical protein
MGRLLNVKLNFNGLKRRRVKYYFPPPDGYERPEGGVAHLTRDACFNGRHSNENFFFEKMLQFTGKIAKHLQ